MPNFPKNPDGMKPSGFKMKGSPHKMGTIQGTSGHASALKQATIESLKQQELDYEANRYDEAKIKSDQVIADREAKKKKDAYDLTDEGKAEIKKAKEAKEAANAPKPKEKNWREKKGEFQTQKKDFRKTRGDFKKGNREEIAELKASGATKEEINAAKEVNKQEQKDLKSAHKDDNKAAKEAWKSDPEYQKHRAENKQKFKDSMNRLAMTVHPNYDPSKVADFDESIRTRGQKEETERINNAYKEAETKRINNVLSGSDAYSKKKKELAKDPSYAQGDGGMDNTDTKND